MKKYIYKITNLIDGKVYIGQTNNPNNRWKEHCRLGSCTYINNKHKSSHLYLAMKKYGIENFSFQVIEEVSAFYNEREVYWIQYYNSYLDKTKGYNLTIGGEDPPVKLGEDSPFSIFSNVCVEQIQQDLAKNIKSYDEICNEYTCSMSYLTLINAGKIRRDNNLIYPLRSHKNERKPREIVEQIIFDLLYTEYSIEEIARRHDISSKVIYKINHGKHIYSIPEVNYPIREPYTRLSSYMLQEIIKDLLDNQLQFKEIEVKYNLSKSTINRINQGKNYYQKNIIYPIRSSTNRVYN